MTNIHSLDLMYPIGGRVYGSEGRRAGVAIPAAEYLATKSRKGVLYAILGAVLRRYDGDLSGTFIDYITVREDDGRLTALNTKILGSPSWASADRDFDRTLQEAYAEGRRCGRAEARDKILTAIKRIDTIEGLGR